MNPVTLILYVVDPAGPGSPEEELERLGGQALRPLLGALKAQPQARLALVLSHSLGSWVEKADPELLVLMRDLVAGGQLEPIAAPLHGLLPSAVPERDAVAALTEQKRWLEEKLAAPVRGLWMQGAAWHPDLPVLAARSGLMYLGVDEGLLVAGGLAPQRAHGWWVAERSGAAVAVLPVDRGLSASLPWGRHRSLLSELQRRGRQGPRCITLMVGLDDLGADEASRSRCWTGRQPWGADLLRHFNRYSSWLRAALPGMAIDRLPPSGKVWPMGATAPADGTGALPGEEASLLEGMLQRGLSEGGPAWEGLSRLVTPPWEAWLSRSDAANRLHKAMLRSSAAVQALRKEAQAAAGKPEARRLTPLVQQASAHLARGQCWAACHEGRGGRLTDPVVRHAAWRALVEAETLARQGLGQEGLAVEQIDYDCDGHREILVRNAALRLVVRPSRGGAVHDLVVPGVGNLCNTLPRSEEGWHGALMDQLHLPALVGEEGLGLGAPIPELEEPTDEAELSGGHGAARPRHPAPAPDRPGLKALEGGLERLLAPDRHVRGLFHERFLSDQLSVSNLARGQPPELGDFLDGDYRCDRVEEGEEELRVVLSREGTVRQGEKVGLLQLNKVLHVRRSEGLLRASYELVNRSREPMRGRFAVELNFNLDGARLASRSLRLPNQEPLPFDAEGLLRGVTDAAVVFADAGLHLRLRASGAPDLLHHPLESVRRTASGYQSALQGLSLVFVWEGELWGTERRRMELALSLVRRQK